VSVSILGLNFDPKFDESLLCGNVLGVILFGRSSLSKHLTCNADDHSPQAVLEGRVVA